MLPHNIFICAVCFWQQTATISLCSVYQLVFPMEALCSLCGTNWTIKQQILVFQGRAMAQSVSHRPVTVETRLHSQASPFEICRRQSGNRTVFFLPEFHFSAVTFSPAVIHTYIHPHVAVIKTKVNAGDHWNSNALSEIGECCVGKHCHFFFSRRG